MNYWLLSTEFPPFFGGGIGTYCAATATMLGERGHEVSVFVNDAAVSDTQIVTLENNIRVIRFSTSRTKSSSSLGHVTNISYEFAHIVRDFVEKEGKPDCIEAQEYLGIAYYLLQYKHLLFDWCKDIPVLITVHSPSFLYMEYNHVAMYRYPNFWICEMERFCLQAADQVIFPSQYMLRELGKRFILNNREIAIIPNPFDVRAYNFDSSTAGQDGDQIVFFGKLTPQKGAFRLLGYFDTLWKEGFNKPLYIIGGQDIVYHPEGKTMGDLIRGRYKEYIKRGLLKLEDRIAPKAIGNRLSKAAVVIVPSDNDNLPYVVFEMMAMGRTVLVSKQGGHSEVVKDGYNGFVFDHNEPHTFFDQLNRILVLDQEKRMAIAERARDTVASEYGPEVIYKRKLAIVEGVTRATRRESHYFPFVRSLQGKVELPAPNHIAGKLTIVVPYFNLGKYIDQTMDSLCESTYEHKEIIIVNDGSTDGFSLRQLEKYRTRPGIRVIDMANGGLAKARNVGARESDGEFLAFVDADDKVRPDYYNVAVRVLRQYNNVHFAGCWVKYFGDSEKLWPAFAPEPPLILFHNLLNSSALVYKREAFLRAGLNDERMTFPGLEDYESVISLAAQGCGGIAIPEPMFQYRVRADSMIRGISKAKKLYLSQYISKKHQTFYATFAVDIFNLLNANGPGIVLDNPSLDYHLLEKMPFGGKLSRRIISLVKRNPKVKLIAYRIYRFLKK